MKVKSSELNFEDFRVMACSFATVQSEKKLSSKELTVIPFDFDFNILFNKKNNSKLKLLIQIESNNPENPVPGYLFSIICEANFHIKGLSKMKVEKKDQYILYTALPLAVSMVRSYLYNISANYPYGQYLLPPIDLQDLFNKKFGKK